jgi:uncharacterized membrane protein YeiH
LYGHNGEVAVILGITTAVGGRRSAGYFTQPGSRYSGKGDLRIGCAYGALIVVLGNYLKWIPSDWVSVLGLTACFALRMLALRYHWNLPVFSKEKSGSG